MFADGAQERVEKESASMCVVGVSMNSAYNVPEHPATGLVVCDRAWPPTLGSCTTSNALTARLCELVQRLFFGAGRVFAL